jgi:hypothetical protein
MMDMTGGPNQLTAHERELLRIMEEQIERREIQGLDKYRAYKQIRDKRLYREGYQRFDDYCRERWGKSRQAVNRDIKAVDIADEIVAAGLPGPAFKEQARKLSRLAVEQRLEVALQIREQGGFRRMSARQVQEIADQVAPRSRPLAKRQPVYAGLALVTLPNGEVRLTKAGRTTIARGLQTMHQGAGLVLRPGTHAIYDVVKQMSGEQVDSLRDQISDVLTACGLVADAIAVHHGNTPAGQQRLAA